MRNIREALRRTSDRNLVNTITDAQYKVSDAELGYKNGSVGEGLAIEASDAQLLVTVGRAVVREKVVNDFSGGHKDLQHLADNPKQKQRKWGAQLSGKRLGN